MGDILIRDVSAATETYLRERARVEDRSVQSLAREILDEAAGERERQRRLEQFMERTRAESQRMPQTNSAELIREDRGA